MTERPVDLTDGRSLVTELGGKPVYLTPMPDGTIAVSDRPGVPPRIMSMEEVSAELSGDIDEDDGYARVTDDELFQQWKRFRNGDDAPETHATAGNPEPAASLSETADEDDGYSADELYNAWQQSYAAERGIDPADLAETSGPALSVGDAVEWGEGEGKGRGIVMEQDTSNGNVNVHLCEVVTEGGAGEQLSPTGKTVKIDGAKLRKIDLRVVGTEPVGPELSADFSDDPDAGIPEVGTDADDDATFWTKVQRSLKRMGGGFGA